MLCALLLIANALAGDVVLPTFTPKTTSDFGPAERLTEETLRAFSAAGIAFVPPSEIARRAGEVADGCADEPDCTAVLWRQFPPARLVIVGEVTRAEGKLDARVRFYGPDDISPIEVMSGTISEDEIPGFAQQIAFFATEMVGLVPEREVEGPPVAEEPPPPPPPPPVEPDVEEEPAGEWRELPDPEADEAARRKTGLPQVAWDKYKASGLTYDEWTKKAFVRSGKVVLELYGGVVFGDVDRVYDTRVAVEQLEDDSFEQTDAYQYEAFVRGQGYAVGGGFGYLPAWWVEVGLSGAAILAHKQLSTGWEQYLDGELKGADSESYDPVAAQMAMIEPRLRIYFVATGPIKPYLLGAGNLRIFDGYSVPDLEQVDYPNREGGVGFGVTGGGGFAFDVPGGALFFLEVPWTAMLSPEPYLRGGPAFSSLPEQQTGSRQQLAFRAGLGVRL